MLRKKCKNCTAQATGTIILALVLQMLLTTHAAAERNPFQPVTNATTNISSTTPSPTTQRTPYQLTAANSTTCYTHQLNYAKAGEICTVVQKLFSGKLAAEEITNTILFTGSSVENDELSKLLRQLDTATRQVTLEAKIIALNKEKSKSLGINWNWDNIPIREENTNSSDTDSSSSSNYDGNFKFWHGYAFRFNATLNALIADGKAKVLATPRIITIPGREASIFIGDHIPVQTEKHDSSGSYTTTEYLDAGISLKYTPIVSQDGSMVTTAVHTEVSTPVLISELKNYRITSRKADTNVRMFSGETLVIGGLISEEEQRNIQRVPLLSSIPLLGELFKNRTSKHSTSEVIMLLTPHITEAGKSPSIYSDNELK